MSVRVVCVSISSRAGTFLCQGLRLLRFVVCPNDTYSFLVVLLAPHHLLVKTEDSKTSFFGFSGAIFLCFFRKTIFCVLFKW